MDAVHEFAKESDVLEFEPQEASGQWDGCVNEIGWMAGILFTQMLQLFVVFFIYLLGCTCCVGVLNGAFHEKILADVQQLVEKGDYDVKAFSLNIKLPSVVLLREYSLLRFLRSDVENFSRKTPFDMKDVLKVWRRT